MLKKSREKSPLASCSACGLKDCGYVPPQLPLNPEWPILWVGQAGGETEDVTGIPFTGKTGKLLWRLMKEAGFNKVRQNITNMVGCVPPKDRKPNEFEIAACSAKLLNEIDRLQPKLIIAMGDVAVKALTGKVGIKTHRGQCYPLSPKWRWQCDVLCLLHPSFLLRQRQWLDTAVEDMKLAIPYLLGERVTVTKLDQVNFVNDPTPSEFASWLEKWSKEEVAFDIETPGELNPRKAQVVGISFCGEPNVALALDVRQGDERWDIIKRFLEDPNARKITQNGQFDIACLETSNIKVRGLTFDTMLVEHLISSDLPHDLDFLRGRYTDIQPYKPPKSRMKTFHHWAAAERLEYSCWDALVTWRVAQEQKKHMTPAFWKILKEIDLPLIEVVNSMERKGIKVDIPVAALLYQQLLPQIEEFEREVFTPYGLNPNSPKQLLKFLQVESTGKDVLKAAIKKEHPLAPMMQAVLDYRDLNKVASVYIQGIVDRLEEGRIHAHFSIPGTGTGRLSSSNPNLQNVPKEMRIIYIPDNEDFLLADADYNQLEFKVVAVMAKEEKLLRELAEGINIHHKLGMEMFGKTWDHLSDIQKLREKAVVFGTIGGRGARSIAIEFGVPISLAEEWQNICFTQYPKFREYKEEKVEIFNTTGLAYTAYGRRREVTSVPKALNTPMQGSAGDVTKTTMLELYKLGIDLRITVHDSIIAQLPKEPSLLQDGLQTIKRVMERPIPELDNYSFSVKIGVGPNWYQQEEVKCQ